MKLHEFDRVVIRSGRMKGQTGMIVSIRETRDLPFLVRIGNNRELVGFTAHELRRG